MQSASKNGLHARQERMRQRQLVKPAVAARVTVKVATWNPVDYSKAVSYTAAPAMLSHCPKVNGVYMLEEAGRYYIGQSTDVAARFHSHRFYPISCHMEDPRGVLLAAIPYREDWNWSQNNHVRLNGEARFIAAALKMCIPLTNQLSPYKKDQLLSRFADLAEELSRIESAVRFLC